MTWDKGMASGYRKDPYNTFGWSRVVGKLTVIVTYNFFQPCIYKNRGVLVLVEDIFFLCGKWSYHRANRGVVLEIFQDMGINMFMVGN